MIDEKGKLFGKISIIDICVVLVVLIAIFGFAYKITKGNVKLKVTADTPITMVLQIKGVRQYAMDAVDIGDDVYERSGPRLGKVTGVRSDAFKDVVALNNGTQVYSEVEGRYNIYITVEGTGRLNEDGYYINGTRFVAVGSEIKIASKRITGDSNVYEVSNS